IMDNVMYEPEQFPGLIYRMGEPKVVMLLFASGKLVCTGAKYEKMVREAVEKLHDILEEEELIYYD
ncbi:MAG: TATA box-binding protein, partial [Candidatus Bathyarchaeia archaeon]